MNKGKKICEQLKQIRLDIARENGIEYTPNECHHDGDCAGTCPACDSELRYLEREISRKRSLGKVALIGISMGIASLSLSSCIDSNPSHEHLMGDVPADTLKLKDDTTLGDIYNPKNVQRTAEINDESQREQ